MTGATRHVDHLVIGGGPAGAFAAMRLAAAGCGVTLVEKESGPHHKVCGEFLSREALEYLKQAGISPHDLGAASIGNVRLSAGKRMVIAPLPFQALSLSRRALDEALLVRAEKANCEVHRGVAVESLAPAGPEWIASLSDGSSLHAHTVFLATGKHNLRGFPRFPAKQSDLVGFKLHWRLAPANIQELRGFMDLYLFPGGYGGLSLIENDDANLCLVVRRATLRTLGGWPQLIAFLLDNNRHLGSLLDGATPLWPQPLAISPIPYGYLVRERRGLWCIGDQAAVIPSFTGDGISIALHSATLAAQMFLSGASAEKYAHTLHAQLARSMSLATWLSRIAVTRAGRIAALAALTLAPNAMRWIAAYTRIPRSSLVLSEFLLEGSGPAAR